MPIRGAIDKFKGGGGGGDEKNSVTKSDDDVSPTRLF